MDPIEALDRCYEIVRKIHLNNADDHEAMHLIWLAQKLRRNDFIIIGCNYLHWDNPEKFCVNESTEFLKP